MDNHLHGLRIHRGRLANKAQRLGHVAAFCVLTILPTVASAGGYATISLGPNQRSAIKVEWRNASTARFDLGPSAYSILRAGKLYIVSAGRVMSADMLKHMGPGGRRESGANTVPEAKAIKYAKPVLQGPLGSETIAGIRGHIYKLTFGGHTNEVVLTDNRLVRELTQVWTAYAASMSDNPVQTAKAMDRIYDNKGELRVANDFRLVSINGNTPPASDFVLPAKPTSMPAMPNMSSMFSGHHPSQGVASGQNNHANISGTASSDSGSGSFFDKIKNKFKQTEQQQGDHVDNRVTQKTNDTVNHAVDHVLGKLFGN